MQRCHAGLYLANLGALLMDKGARGVRQSCKGGITAITACLEPAGVTGGSTSQDQEPG